MAAMDSRAISTNNESPSIAPSRSAMLFHMPRKDLSAVDEGFLMASMICSAG
jgi:hypothetical protein